MDDDDLKLVVSPLCKFIAWGNMKLNVIGKVDDDHILNDVPLPKEAPYPLAPKNVDEIQKQGNVGSVDTETNSKTVKNPVIKESESNPELNVNDGKDNILDTISQNIQPPKPLNTGTNTVQELTLGKNISNGTVPKIADSDPAKPQSPINTDTTDNKSKTSAKKDDPKLPVVTQPIIKDGTSGQEVETNGEDPSDTLPNIDGDQEQKNEENLLNENDLLKSGVNNPDEEATVSQKNDDDDDDYIGETDEGSSNIVKPVPKTKLRPENDDDVIIKHDPFVQEQDSNFIIYLMFFMFISIIGYVAYHNKGKILALVLEGRRSSTHNGRGGGGRRKHTAAYRKLDSNLEEAITSNTNGSRTTQNIIY